MFKLDLEKAEEPEIKLPTSIGWSKKQESSRKNIYFCFIDYVTMPKPLPVWITTSRGIFFNKWEYQTTLPASWKYLYAVQEAAVKTGHETTHWFQIGKRVRQGCILSPCLFNLHAEYLKWNTSLDEAQARINTVGRNINNLRYADYSSQKVKSN